MTNYVVATIKPWNIEAFRRNSTALSGRWFLIDSPEDLTAQMLAHLRPRYVFFPHWSWRVPAEILSSFECVCFHMTDVPFGRGGSPLQNLIVRGFYETKLTALRMVDEMDAGPVYLKKPLSLDGRAEEIYVRAADLVWEMIGEMCRTEPVPKPQHGEPVVFPRRRPDQSELPSEADASALYDFIRMLDAPTYPKATIRWGQLRIEFDRAVLNGDVVEARAIISSEARDSE
ncbi:MAG: methionyl-tRNA formyltransferase [Bacteroidales bacterium]|nr:methionyl-tRNA formyltransferase [Bacteroidales bacterium]